MGKRTVFRGIYKRKVIEFSAGDYQKLLHRFDHRKRAVRNNIVDEYRLTGKCPLCVKYLDDGCSGCPLDKFSVRSSLKNNAPYGCGVVVQEIWGEGFPGFFGVGSITWNIKNNRKARKCLDMLTRRLLRFEMIV